MYLSFLFGVNFILTLLQKLPAIKKERLAPFSNSLIYRYVLTRLGVLPLLFDLLSNAKCVGVNRVGVWHTATCWHE